MCKECPHRRLVQVLVTKAEAALVYNLISLGNTLRHAKEITERGGGSHDQTRLLMDQIRALVNLIPADTSNLSRKFWGNKEAL